jgi:hypothetical protein
MNLMLGKLYQISTNNHSTVVCYKECFRYDISNNLFFLDFQFKYIRNFIFLLKFILNLSITKIFCDQFSIKVLLLIMSSFHETK